MNLAFLISFMTFHFYLNLAFHTNIFTIKIVIVTYINFLKKKNIDWISTLSLLEPLWFQPASTDGTFSKQSLATYFLTLTFFDFISVGICHIFFIIR